MNFIKWAKAVSRSERTRAAWRSMARTAGLALLLGLSPWLFGCRGQTSQGDVGSGGNPEAKRRQAELALRHEEDGRRERIAYLKSVPPHLVRDIKGLTPEEVRLLDEWEGERKRAEAKRARWESPYKAFVEGLARDVKPLRSDTPRPVKDVDRKDEEFISGRILVCEARRCGDAFEVIRVLTSQEVQESWPGCFPAERLARSVAEVDSVILVEQGSVTDGFLSNGQVVSSGILEVTLLDARRKAAATQVFRSNVARPAQGERFSGPVSAGPDLVAVRAWLREVVANAKERVP
jgi:hypothetical protein